jgi:hypothetical protein
VEALAVLDVVAVDELLVAEDVAVGVHDALRHSGRARRVVELGRILGRRVGGLEVGRQPGQRVGAEDEDLVLDPGRVEARRVGLVGDEHLRLRVGQAVADAVIAIEHRHRQQDRPDLPGGEEDGGRLGRGREDDGDAVAALHAVLHQPVRGLVGKVLQLAPAQLAGRAVVALPDHRRLVARVLVAHVGGDVVALGHAPFVLGARLLVRGRGARCHGSLPVGRSVRPGVYQTLVFDANGGSRVANC